MWSRFVKLPLACGVVLVASVLPAATGGAPALATKAVPTITSPSNAQLPGVVSATTVPYTPNVYAGNCSTSVCNPSTVYSTVIVNGEMVVAGAFTEICTPVRNTSQSCPTMTPADYIFAFNPVNGAIDTSFKPVLDTGPVRALAVGPDNTVYAGGAFTSVNGVSEPGLVQLNVTPADPSTDGKVVTTFVPQIRPGTVRRLAVNGNALYVAGDFFTKVYINGARQKAIARLDATTGLVDKTFAVTLGDPVPNTVLQLGAMALTPDGSMLAIGGSFQSVDGQPISRVALIETGGAVGTAPTLDDWSAPDFTNACKHQHDYVDAIDFSPDGSFFVVADTGFASAPGASVPALCDAAARFETSGTGTDIEPTWVDYTGGDTLRSVAIAGSVVYIGGHQRWVNNQCGSNHACEANAVLVNGLAALDANTGIGLPWWTPGTSRGVGVESLTTYPAGAFAGPNGEYGGLIIGTPVSSIGGVTHQKLAMFPLLSSAAPTPGGTIRNGMFNLGRVNNAAAQCLADPGNSVTSGTAVEQTTCDNDPGQDRWVEGAGNTIQINGLCLDTQSPTPSTGTPVVLNTCSTTGATTQQWVQAPGTTTLVNQAVTTLCLTDPNGNTASGTVLQVQTCSTTAAGQSWPLPVSPATPAPPSTGALYSASQEQTDTQVPCADDQGDGSTTGTPVVINTCLEEAQETWTAGPDNTFTINGLCMDLTGGATSNGTLVELNTCVSGGTPSQEWLPGPNYELVNQLSKTCLTDPSTTAATGTQLDISTCGGSSLSEQKWRLPVY